MCLISFVIIILAKSERENRNREMRTNDCVLLEKFVRDKKERKGEKTYGEMIYLGREIKMLGWWRHRRFRLLIYSITEASISTGASERRCINARCSCALLRSRCANLRRTRHPRLRFMRTNENYIAR